MIEQNGPMFFSLEFKVPLLSEKTPQNSNVQDLHISESQFKALKDNFMFPKLDVKTFISILNKANVNSTTIGLRSKEYNTGTR